MSSFVAANFNAVIFDSAPSTHGVWAKRGRRGASNDKGGSASEVDLTLITAGRYNGAPIVHVRGEVMTCPAVSNARPQVTPGGNNAGVRRGQTEPAARVTASCIGFSHATRHSCLLGLGGLGRDFLNSFFTVRSLHFIPSFLALSSRTFLLFLKVILKVDFLTPASPR